MSNQWFYRDPKQLFCPYSFVLKEGGEIQKNSLDYSLMMVDMAMPERLPSFKPAKSIRPQSPKLVLPPEVYSTLEDEY